MGYTKSVHFCTFRDMRKVRNPVSARDPPHNWFLGFWVPPLKWVPAFWPPETPYFGPFWPLWRLENPPNSRLKPLSQSPKTPEMAFFHPFWPLLGRNPCKTPISAHPRTHPKSPPTSHITHTTLVLYIYPKETISAEFDPLLWGTLGTVCLGVGGLRLGACKKC